MGKALRILVVDDSTTARRLVVMRLQALQSAALELTIDEAEDGETAIEQYKQARPDLVLLDLTMPGIGGFETLKALVAHDSQARVVIVSADVQDEARSRAIAAGAAGFIGKPVTPGALAELLESHV